MMIRLAAAMGTVATGAVAFAFAVPDTAPAQQQAPAEQRLSAHGDNFADAYRDTLSNIDDKTREVGNRVYGEVCAACHETGLNRAPQRFLLEQMTPESVHRAMTSGVMQPMAAALSDEERGAVAQFLTKRKFAAGGAEAGPKMCATREAAFDRNAPPAFAGWGLDPASTHSIPASVSGLDKKNVSKLKLKWAFGFPNALRARSQPAIAGGAIFVGSHNGNVYALDIKTGCARWTFPASAEVRTGIVVQPWKAGDAGAEPLAFFGDIVGGAYAVKAFTGELVWKIAANNHHATTLTGTPSYHDGTLYVPVSSLEEGGAIDGNYACCTFRGSILAVDAKTGAEKWRTYLVDEPTLRGKNALGADQYGPSGVAVWNSPSIDVKRGQLYVATGDNYSSPATEMSDAIVAIDLKSGKIRWHHQVLGDDAWNGSCDDGKRINCPEEDGPDFDFGAGTVLAKGKDGKEYVLSGQKSGWAYGMNPDDGALVWRTRVGRGGVVAGGIPFGLAAENGKVFIPVSDAPDGRKYDIPQQAGVHALDIATGAFVWRAHSANNVCNGRPLCYPGYGGSLTVTNGLVLAGSNDGYLRIYDTADGKVLWENDTTGSVVTVNGTTAHGGSMGGGAAAIAYQGLLIANSGYGFSGKMPGNVLLVYGTDE